MPEAEQDQKTEEPTDKRLEEARDEGQLPISREISTLFMLLAMFAFVVWFAPAMMGGVATTMRSFIEMPHAFGLEDNGLQGVFIKVLQQIGLVTATVFSIFFIAAVLGTALQTGFYVNPTRLKFDMTRISPQNGFQMIFSANALAELFKSFIKLVVMGWVSVTLLKPLLQSLPLFSGRPLEESMTFLHDESRHLMIVLIGIVIVIAVSDILYQRHRYYKSLRMTKQEIKDEHKQMEGDPMIKARLRQIRIEKARKRMMAKVPKADVVITNPTHYAVALKYDNTKMMAPVVLAKGVDRVAERIRAVATENEVPLVSNPPLARTLYDTVELDHAIKPEHYRAVAEVISYVYKLKKKIWKRIPPT